MPLAILHLVLFEFLVSALLSSIAKLLIFVFFSINFLFHQIFQYGGSSQYRVAATSQFNLSARRLEADAGDDDDKAKHELDDHGNDQDIQAFTQEDRVNDIH